MRKKGIVLVTALLFTGVIIMICTVTASLGKAGLESGTARANSEQAAMAAMSGIAYVQGEISKNGAFGKDGKNLGGNIKNGDTVIISDKDHKCVVGCLGLKKVKGIVKEIKSIKDAMSADCRAKFLISFNDDAKDEYRKEYNIPLSVNLLGNGTLNNNQRKQLPRPVATDTFHIAVKGISGKSMKTAEALLIDNGPECLNGGSVIMGDVDLKIGLDHYKYSDTDPLLTIANHDYKTQGQIMSKGRIDLYCQKANITKISSMFNTKAGTMIGTGKSNGLKIDGKNITLDESHPETYKELVKNGISCYPYNVNESELNSIGKMSNALKDCGLSGQSFQKMQGGTYIYLSNATRGSDFDETKGRWVYTSDQNPNLNDCASLIRNSGQLPSLPDGISIGNDDDSVRKVKIKGNVQTTGAVNFVAIDKRYNRKTGVTSYFKSPAKSIDLMLSGGNLISGNENDLTADINIHGEITGNGKIFSNGKLTMNAGSALETRKQSGVGIWSQNGVELNSAQNLSADSIESELVVLTDGVENALTYTVTGEPIDTGNGRYYINELAAAYKGGGQAMKVGQYVVAITGTGDYKSAVSIYEDLGEGEYKYLRSFTKESLMDRLNRDDIYGGLDPNDSSKHDYESDGSLKADKAFSSDCSVGNVKMRIRSNVKEKSATRGTVKEAFVGSSVLEINGKVLGTIDVNNQTSNGDSGSYKGPLFDRYKKQYTANQCMDNGYILFSLIDHSGKEISGYSPNGEILTNFTPKKPGKGSGMSLPGNYSSAEEYLEAYYRSHVKNTSLKGTIYSNGRIKLDGNGHSINVIGAIIGTGNSGLNVWETSTLSLLFHPDYVPFFKNRGRATKTVYKICY